MSVSTTILEQLQTWYANECNGDWEHTYGVKIETLDNPGWLVAIDLRETDWDHQNVPRSVVERDESDWVQHEVSNGKFIGCGGPGNLEEILELFLKFVANVGHA